MKKYGFFGGSFNPVTFAHINLAKLVLNKYNLDKIIFIPMGNNYPKEGLIDEKYRYEMLKIATKKCNKLEVSDIELGQEKNLTTLEAFYKIENKYENVERYYIVGADNLKKITLSKDLKILAKKFNYIVINRDEIDCKDIITSNDILKYHKNNFQIMENYNNSKISATKVRQNLKDYKETKELIPKEVLSYIKKNNLYF